MIISLLPEYSTMYLDVDFSIITCWFTAFKAGQNDRHLADDIFRCIFANEKFCILIKISLKFVPKGPIDNNPALA